MEEKRKRKNYFTNQGKDQKKRKRLVLECGMTGFLCTCNFREKDCIREAYNLLNEYIEKIHELKKEQPKDQSDKKPINEEEAEEKNKQNDETDAEQFDKKVDAQQDDEDETKDGKKVETKVDSEEKVTEDKAEKQIEEVNKEEEDDEDISAALSKEIDELKAEAEKSPLERQFQVVDTGVSNVIFIKTTVPDTLELVTAIVKDLHETKKQRTRYLLRMLPIQIACKAYMDDIKPKANILFDKYFVKEPKTYCIVVNRHSNNNLHRSEIIEDLAQIITSKNPGNKANLKSPEIAIVVEVIRAICLISIAPNYFMYKKYNLLEICNNKEK